MVVSMDVCVLVPELWWNVPLVEVDIGLLANQVGVSATNTLDLGQGVHHLLFAIDLCTLLLVTCSAVSRFHLVAAAAAQFSSSSSSWCARKLEDAYAEDTHVGVEKTQDELEVRLFTTDERHVCGW